MQRAVPTCGHCKKRGHRRRTCAVYQRWKRRRIAAGLWGQGKTGRLPRRGKTARVAELSTASLDGYRTAEARAGARALLEEYLAEARRQVEQARARVEAVEALLAEVGHDAES